jgi:O-methyltransferase involved in polyketide biosynthesis
MWVAVAVAVLLVVVVAAAAATRRKRPPREADLSVTALYTNGAWAWARLPGAELLVDKDGTAVFNVTNFVLALPAALRRAPSLRCSLVQRHVMIDRLIAGAEDVLELAAGLSRRGVYTSGHDVRYTEVDRAPVISRKRALLERTEAGRAALARPSFRLVAGDVTDVPLADLVTAPPGAPLHVIAEGLMMYLDAEQQRALWRRVHALFAGRSGLFVFDLVPAAERMRSRVFGGLMKAATKGGSLRQDARTREDIAGELREIGFAVELLEPRDVPDLPHRDVRTQQLLFVCRAGAGAATPPPPGAAA